MAVAEGGALSRLPLITWANALEEQQSEMAEIVALPQVPWAALEEAAVPVVPPQILRLVLDFHASMRRDSAKFLHQADQEADPDTH